MALLRFAVSGRRVVTGDYRRSDLFVFLAYSFLISLMLFRGMPNSPSPDLPVMILTVEVAWLFLLLADPSRNGAANLSRAGLLPSLLLAGGAVCIKLSAVPLLVASCCYYLMKVRLSLRHAAVAAGLSVVLISPLAAAGFITSGCVFFPSTQFLHRCLLVSWFCRCGQRVEVYP